LQAVNRFLADVKEMKDHIIGDKPTCLRAKLVRASSDLKIRKGTERGCPQSTDSLLEQLADADGICDSLTSAASGVSDSGLEHLQDRRSVAEKTVAELGRKINAQVDALDYLRGQRINDKRCQYQGAHWQKIKVVQHLILGGEKKDLAAKFAAGIGHALGALASEGAKLEQTVNVKLDVEAGGFDIASAHAWSSASMVGTALSSKLSNELETLKRKQEVLEEKLLQKENSKWSGTVGDVQGLAANVAACLVGEHDLVHSDMRGADARVYAMKANGKRCGPTALPSPGTPTLHYFFEDVFVYFVPAAPLLDLGIAIKDFTSFLRNALR